MQLRGRHWVLLWLALFVVVAAAVETRQLLAFRTVGRLNALSEQRRTLEARQADLDRRIATAQSRDVLARRAAEVLGLHHPDGSELKMLNVPINRTGRR